MNEVRLYNQGVSGDVRVFGGSDFNASKKGKWQLLEAGSFNQVAAIWPRGNTAYCTHTGNPLPSIRPTRQSRIQAPSIQQRLAASRAASLAARVAYAGAAASIAASTAAMSAVKTAELNEVAQRLEQLMRDGNKENQVSIVFPWARIDAKNKS